MYKSILKNRWKNPPNLVDFFLHFTEFRYSEDHFSWYKIFQYVISPPHIHSLFNLPLLDIYDDEYYYSDFSYIFRFFMGNYSIFSLWYSTIYYRNHRCQCLAKKNIFSNLLHRRCMALNHNYFRTHCDMLSFYRNNYELLLHG